MKITTSTSFYSDEQILQYLQHIGFSSTLIEGITPNLDNLTEIVRKHLITFPFENLAMHYTKDGDMDVSPAGVFDRMVAKKKGFGSYCFGHNTLLWGVLSGLGYKVAAGAARVNGSIDPTKVLPLSLVHMILFVQLPKIGGEEGEEQLYLVDVGFGGVFGMSGLVRPIPLVPDILHSGSAPPEEHRLILGPHPSSNLLDNDYWQLQARCGRPDWKTLYLFKVAEHFLEDFADFSFGVSKSRGGIMTTLVICIKPSPLGPVEEDKDGDPLQRNMVVANKHIKRLGTTVEELQVFTTEEERLAAFESACGVVIDDKQAALEAITGKVSKLHGDDKPGSTAGIN